MSQHDAGPSVGRIFTRDELTQTIARAGDPFKHPFMLTTVDRRTYERAARHRRQDVDLSNPE